MWAAIRGIALLKTTPIGSTATIAPVEPRVTPSGAFIHALADTTEMLPNTPATAIGTPVQKWAQGLRRRHPKM